MSKKQVALDVAAFLDSPQARALDGVGREQVVKISEAFLWACYEDLGKKPHLLDGDDVQSILGRLLPERLAPKDPLAPRVPDVLTAFFEHLSERHVVANPFEIARGLATTTDEFLEAVRTGENLQRRSPPQEPFVHRAEKLGRNDPCFCGSGRKFKKCHGK